MPTSSHHDVHVVSQVPLYIHMKKAVTVGSDKPVVPGQRCLEFVSSHRQGLRIILVHHPLYIHKVNQNACGSVACGSHVHGKYVYSTRALEKEREIVKEVYIHVYIQYMHTVYIYPVEWVCMF